MHKPNQISKPPLASFSCSSDEHKRKCSHSKANGSDSSLDSNESCDTILLGDSDQLPDTFLVKPPCASVNSTGGQLEKPLVDKYKSCCIL